MKQPYPCKIEPCPIISASFEIRFETIDVPVEAVFGMFYNILKDEFSKHDPLSILEIPEVIRVKEGLIEQPHYRLYQENSPLSILLGPKVLSIVYTKFINNEIYPYPGWTISLKSKVNDILLKIFSLNIIKHVTRIGIRYSDFIDGNIFDGTEFNLLRDGERLDREELQIVRIENKNDFINKITISNKFNLDSSPKSGSLIDIDSYKMNEEIKIEDVFNFICIGHDINKELFFDMLKKDYIDSKFSCDFNIGE